MERNINEFHIRLRILGFARRRQSYFGRCTRPLCAFTRGARRNSQIIFIGNYGIQWKTMEYNGKPWNMMEDSIKVTNKLSKTSKVRSKSRRLHK